MIVIKEIPQYAQEQLDALIIKIKAVIYARVSTQDQAQHGYSLDSQIERCRDLAINKFNYKDDEILALVEEGEMGDDPNRPALNHALFLLENGVGKKFVMLHPDRLSRYSRLQNEIAERVWACGADLEFVEMTVDPNNPESMFMFNIQGAVSQYNKAKILANSKRGRLQKAKSGQIAGLRRVYGYTFNKDKDILEENPEEKEVYLTMVDLLLNHNKSIADIARYLSTRNIPAPIGDVWYRSVISRILRNEVYTGNYFYGKTEIVQKMGVKTTVKKPREQWNSIPIPAYIDHETFDQIQIKMSAQNKSKRGAKTTITYLAKGLAFCGECGSTIRAATPYRDKKTKEVISYYYRCSNKEPTGFIVGTGEANLNCNTSRWKQDLIDDIIWNYLIHLLKPEQVRKRLKQITNSKRNNEAIDKAIKEKERIIKQINELKDEIEQCKKLFRKKHMTEEEYDTEVEKLMVDINSQTNELRLIEQEIKSSNITVDQAKLIEERCKLLELGIEKGQLTDEEKRATVESVIQKIVINSDSIDFLTILGNEKLYNSSFSQNNYTNYTVNELASIAFKDRIYLPTNAFTNQEFRVKFSNINKEDIFSIKQMYYEQSRTIEEICEEKELNRETVISIITLKDRRSPFVDRKIKRDKDFSIIYDLHFNKEISLKEIYRRYGYSTVYSKRVLEERGYTIINRWLKKNRDSGQAIEE